MQGQIVQQIGKISKKIPLLTIVSFSLIKKPLLSISHSCNDFIFSEFYYDLGFPENSLNHGEAYGFPTLLCHSLNNARLAGNKQL